MADIETHTTPSHQNKDQIRLHQGSSENCLGLDLGGRYMAGGSIGLYSSGPRLKPSLLNKKLYSYLLSLHKASVAELPGVDV